MRESISVVDFETEKIESRPVYPPRPVGVAIQWPDKAREYLAFGHPTKNNCSIATARRKLADAYKADRVVFHHAAFDVDVAACHLGLDRPKRIDDTLFLAFLKDPYLRELGLKPLGEKHAGIKPKARDRLREWLGQNVPELKRSDSKWGEYICRAPGDIAGRYAMDDVRTTGALFDTYLPEIDERGMRAAYERELKVLPITMEMERSGIRVHRKKLREARDVFHKLDQDILKRICRKLKLDPKNMKSDDNPKGFNLNSSDQLASALVSSKKLSHTIKTKTGKVSTKMDNLKECCNDPELLSLLAVHSVADTYQSTFINPWLAKADATGGRLLPKFNQVRGYDEGGGGARSGRFSSGDPNLQNISANVEESKNKDTLILMQKWLRDDYDYEFIGLRDFFLPDEGTCIIATDYNQQELRMLAHFTRGVLEQKYIDNPEFDVHDYCGRYLKKNFSIDLPRKAVKIIVFGLVFGMGVGKMADGMKIHPKIAKQARDGILDAIPGIKKLMKKLHKLADHNEPLVTWGGREYFCEEPRMIKRDGHTRMVSFEYKMLNYKIQPSAADYTKEGMIAVAEEVPQVRIAVQVHDELLCMAPNESYAKQIQRAMCRGKLRVPMLAESKISWESWARAA